MLISDAEEAALADIVSTYPDDPYVTQALQVSLPLEIVLRSLDLLERTSKSVIYGRRQGVIWPFFLCVFIKILRPVFNVLSGRGAVRFQPAAT